MCDALEFGRNRRGVETKVISVKEIQRDYAKEAKRRVKHA